MAAQPNDREYGRNYDRQTVQHKTPLHHDRVDEQTLTTRQRCEIIEEARELGAELLETWEDE